MSVFYSCFKVVMKLTLRSYFYKVRIEGAENVPRNTPLIVTPNHQNAFLDALLVGAFIPIPLHYLTRQDVFTWWSRPLLRLLHMLPIYRIRDGYAKLSLNDAVFDSCRKLFNENGSVLIFAEGNHGRHHYLRPLTKGAARLALQSEEALQNGTMVLPVGLNYFNHQMADSTVMIKFGEPIPVKEYLGVYEKNPAKGLIAMRDAISHGMKQTLIIPEESVDYDHQVRTIFQRKHEDFSFQELRSIDSVAVAIDTAPNRKRRVVAWILNPLPMYLIKSVISRVDDVVFHSSLKFGIGLFAFPLWWFIVFLTLAFTTGINIALLAVVVMVFGLYYSYQR